MLQTAFHPGEHLRFELEELGMSQQDLAEQLGVPVSRVGSLVAQSTNMDAELAMRLGHFFGTSPQFWLNLQVLFDLEVAQRKHGAEIAALPKLKAA